MSEDRVATSSIDFENEYCRTLERLEKATIELDSLREIVDGLRFTNAKLEAQMEVVHLIFGGGNK